MVQALQCCRPNPSCLHFCRLDGHLIAGQGTICNPDNGWEYEVIKVLAVGGMGTTYLVYSHHHQKLAVLKEINNELAHKAKVREMFQREARVLNSLHHSGIPQYYDFFATDARYSLIMELIHGQNFAHVEAEDTRQTINWFLELAKILDYLQKCHPPVIHRDIKPSNIILRKNPRDIILIDFGAVKEVTAPPGTCIATPGYGAPEQSLGKACIQSDFYALGTTMIAFLTRLFPSNFYDGVQQKFIGLDLFDVHPILIEVIDRLTEYAPENRPQNAAEVIGLLEEAKVNISN
ncbi:serine/threonine protein kinase [Waterburya agarophytonicola K14]|uniref:Serine/threonine protein kinase n=1 Tax=Waterburya agarophytonicola KI4 TaxID=2874699 RepID=A0A964BNE7_9CYAN|nr:serine/threonine-protein kinase [Waterburya agarophytonicola]MCC0176460.1 serine/threonine protein kinase [Waterburya agarophytonicola KI4]